MSSNAFLSPRQPLPSSTLTHDTYSVTFDTRKAWGSWEAPSTLQSKEEMSGHTVEEPGKSCPELLDSFWSQFPEVAREQSSSPALGQLC